MADFELRVVTRNAGCRCCGKNIAPKTEKVIYTYSHFNRGQNIFICIPCLKDMHNEIVKENL